MMTVRESNLSANTDTCEKCGGPMRIRRLTLRKDKSIKLAKILQCSICRHWVALE